MSINDLVMNQHDVAPCIASHSVSLIYSHANNWNIFTCDKCVTTHFSLGTVVECLSRFMYFIISSAAAGSPYNSIELLVSVIIESYTVVESHITRVCLSTVHGSRDFDLTLCRLNSSSPTTQHCSHADTCSDRQTVRGAPRGGVGWGGPGRVWLMIT